MPRRTAKNLIADAGPVLDLSEDLWNSKRTAKFLDVAEATLKDWRYRDEGPDYISVCGQVRYEPAAVRRWLLANTKRQAS